MYKFKEKVTGEILEVNFDLADDLRRNGMRITRLGNCIKKTEKYIKGINKLNPDGTVPEGDIKSQKNLNKAEKALKDGFDYAFGEGTYNTLFANRNPYALINGTPWSSLVAIAFVDSFDECETREELGEINEAFIATLKKTEDGRVIIPFKDVETGEAFGELLFDPTDIEGNAENFEIYESCFKKAMFYLKQMSADLNIDGTASEDAKNQELLKKAEAELKEGFNTYLGDGAYESVFAKRNPYAAIRGSFYVTQVMKVFRENVFVGGCKNE